MSVVVAKNRCKQCEAELPVVEWRFAVVEHPHNPQFPVTHLDAGLFCGPVCLIDYLGSLRVDREGADR